MTINIKDKEYKLKYTLRALFIFEQITGKPFAINTLLDNYVFYYSIILANNEETVDWDDFIDELDSNPKLLADLSLFMTEQEKKQNILNPEDDLKNKKSGSKKKSRSQK